MRSKMLRVALCVWLAAAYALPAGADEGLAASLPAESTIVFAQVDLGQVLSQAEKSLLFVDAESGGSVISRAQELYGALRELAASYRFRPVLFDRIAECRLYVVLALKDEPEVEEYTVQVPKLDPDSGEMIEGEWQDETVTERHYFTFSFVVEAPEESVARDALDQVKALVGFIKETQGEAAGLEPVQIEVDRGELMGFSGGRVTVGVLGRCVVLSVGQPRELWRALSTPTAESVAATPAFKRLAGADEAVHVLGLVNAGRLFRFYEDQLGRELIEAQASAGESGSEDERNADTERAEALARANMALQAVKAVFSLDKLGHLGAAVWTEVGDRRAADGVLVLLSHGEPLGPVMSELMNGSGAWQLPPVTQGDRIALMGRVNLKAVYDALTAPGQPAAAAVAMFTRILSMRLGLEPAQLLAVLDNDWYLFVGVEETEVERQEFVDFDEEDGRPIFQTRKAVETQPRVDLLWGVTDPTAARSLLETVFASPAAGAEGGALVSKRAYQDAAVYCLGVGPGRDATQPDGATSFASAVAGRYLALGSWDSVTEMIRRTSAAGEQPDPVLAATVEQHRDANLIFVMPRSFERKLGEMSRRQSGTEVGALERLAQQVESASVGLEDAQLEQRLKTAAAGFFRALAAFSAKQQELLPQQTVVTGRHNGSFYELSGTGEMTK